MKQIAERRMMMKQNKKRKNNLDERQEQMLLQVEQRGCWLAFWGLLIALMVQFVLERDFTYMAGEWIVFMMLAVYLAGACVKRGIWDRHFKPDVKTNLAFSAVAAIVYGGVMFVKVYHNYPDKLIGSIASGVFSAGYLFLMVFASLSVMAVSVRKKQKDLEAEPLDEEIEADNLNDPRR